ncbi:MAG: Uridylate kinase [Alphaproteobacteria bacterium MarineAlpha9_Bin5]|nr:MAG: Uridylate kinase [Alphaproteobacteria bacterium MarineAlpha9_Bin5]
MGERGFGLDRVALTQLAEDVSQVHSMGVEICLVVGAGNIFRGLSAAAAGIERPTADGMGMLATVINALGVQSMLENKGVPTRVQSAVRMEAICEPYIRRRAIHHMEQGRVVIFAAGTGNPYFTTDTAAALRAAEMECEVLLKGTQVDGVYSADPNLDVNAERYERLSFSRVLREELKVMDASAISLARENRIPVLVFSIHNKGAFSAVVTGAGQYTLIDDQE